MLAIKTKSVELCPCGSGIIFVECCGRFLEGGEFPTTAELLMRSRYTAYTLLLEDYLLATWHASTRPTALGLAEDVPTKWLGLEVKRYELQDQNSAVVDFVARYKVGGRAHRLREASSFVCEGGRWFYVDGEVS
jgi:SEC-C motif-containing protein